MKFFLFIIISSLGRLPGIIGSTYIGNAAAEKNWLLMIIIGACATLLFILGFIFRNKIEIFIAKITAGKSNWFTNTIYCLLLKEKKW